MTKLVVHLLSFLFFIFFLSCQPEIKTTVEENLKPLGQNDYIFVLRTQDIVPDNAFKIGFLEIRKKNYNLEEQMKIIEKAKMIARNAGANIIQIIHTPDDTQDLQSESLQVNLYHVDHLDPGLENALDNHNSGTLQYPFYKEKELIIDMN